MSRLKIITQENQILRNKSKKIAQITPKIEQLVFDMEKTLKKVKGLGLAAPQVGQNVRLCIINTEKGYLTLINPKIGWKSIRKESEEEGCLSVPETFGNIKRSKVIRVKALNMEGKKISFRAEGLFARVIQHEVDHLNGILIIDKFEKDLNAKKS